MRMSIRRSGPAWAGAFALTLAACGGGDGGGTATHEETPVSATEDATVAGATAGTVVAEADGVRLVRGARSEPRMAGARARILEPAAGATVEGPDVTVRLAAEAFEPGAMTPGAESRGIAVSGQGQHVHLIIDEQPYHAIYDLSEPVVLEGIEPGPHVLSAFPSRAWHEAVKADGALAMIPIFVAAADAGEAVDAGSAPEVDGPTLLYSRPKGTYAGADADSVMVDFYLSNVDLSPEGYTARLTVDDGISVRLTAWVPYYLVGLPAGEHAIRLELIGPGGEPLEGPLTRAERTITIER